MLLRLYFNDPPGKTWQNISSVVAELKEKYTFDVEIIKKTDTAVVKRLLGPKFPSVEVDGKKIAELRCVTREELEAVLGRCG